MTKEIGEAQVSHVQSSKDRAIEYVEIGDYNGAVRSMLSDLCKFPQTIDVKLVIIAAVKLAAKRPLTEQQVREWIDEFN
jgi:hypothetical protein